MLEAFHKVGPQGVALDVATDGVEVVVGLDGEGFETTLVNVARTRGVIVSVPAHAMRVRQPAAERRQFASALGPQDEMPVIGHEGVRQDPHGQEIQGVADDALKGGVIRRLLEQRQAGHRAVEHMVNVAIRSLLWPS
jgi:hypothetical protein